MLIVIVSLIMTVFLQAMVQAVRGRDSSVGSCVGGPGLSMPHL